MSLAYLVLGQTPLVRHTFIFEGPAQRSVSVAGTFNDWNKAANPLRKEGRRWVATLDLPLGKILYKYVLDNEKWVLDPGSKSEKDESGNENSVLLNLPDSYRMPAHKGDGRITSFGISHSGRVPDVARWNGDWKIRLRERSHDVEQTTLCVGGKRIVMREVSRDGYLSTYEASLHSSEPVIRYHFELRDGSSKVTYSSAGLGKAGADFVARESELAVPAIPTWVPKTVVYQIFPDRFENGSHLNDKEIQPWSAEPTWFNRFGGDVAGVVKRVGYLKDLGIGAVYFNPVFASPANHRYETSDYFKIDPGFGTNEEFAQMTRTLKSNGIRTILDGVFNHTATNFFAFKDLVAMGEQSRFKSWYFVKSYPVDVTGPKPNYEAWAGFGSMPKLNVSNPSVRQYLLKVPAFWDGYANVDGWRLDVPNEVQADFWPEFRKVVKSDDKNRWIVGEIWGDGSPWLKGNMFDSVMGYQFRTNTVGFVAEKKLTASQYAEKMMQVYVSYAPAVAQNLMNLLSSHDTERFMTVCGEDARLARLGAFLQFTWPGTPSVYYGEELGMSGGKDPLNRRPMPWDKVSTSPLLGFYKSLVHLRNSLPALQSGDPVILNADDSKETLAFARVLGTEFAVAAINRSSSTQSISLDLSALGAEGHATLHDNLMNILGNGTTSVGPSGQLVVSLPACGVCLLATRKSSSLSYRALPETTFACK